MDYHELVEDKKLGEGSFGVVFLGEYRGNKVAVKRIKQLVVDGSEDITDLTESMTVSTHTPSVQEEAPENDTNSRINDPVRLYLKEMGGVELLSREGEIAIAKRISAGFDVMMSGLSESAQAMREISSWHARLLEGSLLLRDIIDLETTFETAPNKEEMEKALRTLLTWDVKFLKKNGDQF